MINYHEVKVYSNITSFISQINSPIYFTSYMRIVGQIMDIPKLLYVFD
jgi:hypothetical protein